MLEDVRCLVQYTNSPPCLHDRLPQTSLLMTPTTRRPSLRWTLPIAVLVAASPIHAQTLNIGGSSSNFGRTSLSPGFTPDPFRVSVVSGGALNVPTLNLASGCVGYATSDPDYILDLTSSTSFLAIYNEGEGDTGLVVNAPDGAWHCDDDSHSGTNPLVSFSNAPSGQYDIWVTSYSVGDNISGTLHVTELSSLAGGSTSSTGTLSIGGSTSNFGRTSLSPGFTPDPFQVSIVSGGNLNVAAMNLASGCVGYATSDPDYIIDLSGVMAYLEIYNEGEGDTGLVINDPNGNWYCDDDSHTGTDPKISLNKASAGQYDIWVTSYSSGDSLRGTLSVTEIRMP